MRFGHKHCHEQCCKTNKANALPGYLPKTYKFGKEKKNRSLSQLKAFVIHNASVKSQHIPM